MLKELHNGEVVDQHNGFNIIKCHYCEFTHIDPIPPEKGLEKIYSEEYYSTDKPEYIQRYEEDKDWWNLCYDDRYDYFEQHLPQHKRNILDIGSGPGLFLLRGKERGWKVQGIEPSNQAAAYSKNLGLSIKHSFLTLDTDMIEKFNVVHMSEVIEHLPDPLATLNIAYQFLAPGGYICIIAPNDYNPFQHALRTADNFEPWWLAAPHHINYFTPQSLSKLLERVGFEVTYTTSTFPIDIFLLMGDNYVGNDKIGKECHARRKRFEITLKKAGLNGLRKNIAKNLLDLNIGREVIIYGKKV